MTFGHGDTKTLERIATALEKQSQLLEQQNLLIDGLICEITSLKGDDCTLESITRAIQYQRR